MGWFSGGVYHPDPGEPAASVPNRQTLDPAQDREAADKNWTYISRPTSFEVGGRRGGAALEESRYQGLAGAADNRQGPQQNLGDLDADMMRAGMRGQDQDYALQQYRDQMNGMGTTPAQRQMQQGLAAGLGQTRSQVAGARGGGNALVAAQAAGADAAARQTGAYATNAAQLQARQQLGAMQGYGDAASAARAQDVQQAGVYGQTATNQAQLDMGQRQLNDQRNAEYEKMRRDTFNDQLSAQETGEATNAQARENTAKTRQQRENSNSDTRNAILGGIVTTAGSAFSSDVRLKKDIHPAGAQVDQAMDAMSPYGYQYKQPEKYGQGQQVGPMAQDLAATPAGRTAVVNMPNGKLGIDEGQGTKLSLAGLARLNERVRSLEGQQTPEHNPGGYRGTRGYSDFAASNPEWKGDAPARNPGGKIGTKGYEDFEKSEQGKLAEQRGELVLPYRSTPPVKQINVGAPHRETATEKDPHIVDLSHLSPEELDQYKRSSSAIRAGHGTGQDASYVVQARASGKALASGPVPPTETASAAPPEPPPPSPSLGDRARAYAPRAEGVAKDLVLGGVPRALLNGDYQGMKQNLGKLAGR